MQQKVFLINKDVAHCNLSLMDTWAIQKDYVVTTEGYMEKVFPEIGVIPNVYLYTTEPPSCFNNTLVHCVKYDGSFAGAVDTIYQVMFKPENFTNENTKKSKSITDLVTNILKPVHAEDFLLHIRVLGTSSIEEEVKSNNFLQRLAKWNSLNIGVSVAFEGSRTTPHKVIPIWKVYDVKKETSQIQPNTPQNSVEYTYDPPTMPQHTTLPEYLRRWNSCLTCPFLEHYEGAARCTHCGCAQKSKCLWKDAECSDPKTKRW